MFPIPKVKNQIVCDSKKFRAIALSNIIDKVLDWIILMKNHYVALNYSFTLNMSVNNSVHLCG